MTQKLELAPTHWRCLADDELQPYLIHRRVDLPHRDAPPPTGSPALAASFASYQRALQEEYVYCWARPGVVEPQYGFLLADPLTLVPASMPYYERVGLPDLGQHLERWPNRREIQVEAAASLREFGEGNYYHFYSDLLGRLALLARWVPDEHLPLLISQTLYEQPHFQSLLRRSALGRRNWLVQGEQYVAVERLIFCKGMPYLRESLDYVLDLCELPPPDLRAERRVFLTRQAGRGRHLANENEVERVCVEHGFSRVDADQLDLDEQIGLFCETRYLVGIHGAGLVNAMFRRGAPLSLLELFPADNLPPHYYWLSRSYGFDYRGLVGGPSDASGGFWLDPAQLRAELRRLLTQ